MFAERSARVLYAVGSGLHELQHALDGIADLHQRLDVFVLHAGCGSSEHHGLGTHGASELDADPVFRDGEQDVHRDGIRKEPALFQPDNKYRCIGAGIPGRKLNKSIGIMKAYSSCVGDGPFTTELAMTEEEKHLLREAGHEYGAATGRPRRVGPFDVVASRYGVQCQGCDELALTLFDVLDYMEEVPVVAQYKLADGTVTDRFPTGKTLDDAQPVVVKLPGWHCDITSVRKYEDLPEAARGYVEYLEKAVGCKIKYISVGPERDACIIRD